MNAITRSPRTKPRSQKGWVIFLYSKGRAESCLRSGSHSCSDSTRSLQVSSAPDSPGQRSLWHNRSNTKLQHEPSVSAIAPLLRGTGSPSWQAACNTALELLSQLRHQQHKPAGKKAKPARILTARLLPSSWAAALQSGISRSTHLSPVLLGWHCCPHVNPPRPIRVNALALMWKFPTFPVGKR